MKKLTYLLITMIFGSLAMSCTSSYKGNTDLLEKALRDLDNMENKSRDYEAVEVDDTYSIDIADGLTSVTGLNSDASLQYANYAAEKYIIVIDEDKQEFVDVYKKISEYDESMTVIDNYFDVQSSFMDDAGGVTTFESAVLKKKINGMEARQKQFDGEISGIPEPISYWVGYIEGEDRLYTIMAWTLSSRKDAFEKEAHKMIKSLKEL